MNDLKSYIGKELEVIIDRPIGSKHPEFGLEYPVNYGYIPDTINGDGEPIDVYYLGEDKPVEKTKGKCIAVVHRINDDDDKLIIIPDGHPDLSDEEIKAKIDFQEKYFKSYFIR